MRVLITGARGFLGRHVVASLLARGAEPVAAVRDPAGDVGAVRLDLDDDASIDAALEAARCEAVVHCAAYGLDPAARDAEAAFRINALGTAALFRAARRQGVRRFVHVGTCFELGSSTAPQDESAPAAPIGIYGESKAAATARLRELGRDDDHPAAIVRPFVMMGVGERDAKLVPSIARAARTRTRLSLTDGSEVRDYVPVGFVAEALAGLATLRDADFPHGEVLHLCSGEARTVRAFAESLGRALRAESWLAFGERPSRDDVPRHVVGDPSRWRALARSLPGLPVEPPPFDAAIDALARRLRA